MLLSMLRRFPLSAGHFSQTILRTGIAAAVILLTLPPLGAQPEGPATRSGTTVSQVPPATPAAPTTAPNLETLTEAERIAGLQRLLAADQQRLQELDEQLQQLETEFQQAAERFTQLDAQLAATRANGQIVVEAQAVEAQEQARRREALAVLEQAWALARDGFDRIIERRKAVQEQRSIVAEKIAWEQRALSRLTQAQPAAPAAPQAMTQSAGGGEPAPGATTADATPGSPAPVEPVPPRADDLPAEPAAAASPATPSPADEAPQPAATEVVAEPQAVLKEVDEQALDARRELKDKRLALEAAHAEVAEIDGAIEVFERDLQSTERLLASARQDVQASIAAIRNLTAEIEQRTADDAPEAELETLRGDLDTEQTRLQQARQEVAMQTTRLRQSRALLDQLAAARTEAVRKAAKAADAVNAAQSRLLLLESPVAPHRMARWLTRTGPRVIAVLAVMTLLWWLVRALANRSVGALVRHSRRGTAAERDQRADTLRRVFGYAVGLAAVTLGLLAVLHTSGIDVTVLLGGTAVIGAAVAFGSQNLVKDYFSGLMILAENQYSVGNVIRIADTTGTVEDISLRMTVLRDEEGTVHFIPHGQVTKVSNLTHGWSRAVFKIKVAYDEDVDRIMEILMDLASQLRNDEQFGPQMLGQPEMQGVEALEESAIVIKFLVKTRPLMQWSVRRELLRRIKQRFDQLGIQTPLPQRVIHTPQDRSDHANHSQHAAAAATPRRRRAP